MNSFPPHTLRMVHRDLFYAALKDKLERVVDWWIRVMDLVANCDFRENVEEILRDKFICGIEPQCIKSELLALGRMPLQETVQAACQMERCYYQRNSMIGNRMKINRRRMNCFPSQHSLRMIQRDIFYSAVKYKCESVVDWLNRVAVLAVGCDFGYNAEEILRDKFIFGIGSHSIKLGLLAFGGKMSFWETVHVANWLEYREMQVDGQKYVGQGRSKKIARIEAAATALRSFIQFKDGAVLTPLKPTFNVDFTSDEHLENGIDGNDKLIEALDRYLKHARQACKKSWGYRVEKLTRNLMTAEGQKKVPEKGPVMLLYELFNDVHFDCSVVDGVQNCRFKMTVTVNNCKFEGTGPSKKLAKNAAAKAALASLCNISYSPMMHPQKNVPIPIDDKSSSMELPQIHADTIGKLVLEKFMEVIKGQESYSRRKVLAGIVMTENMNFNEAKVISVSTGTKCVSGEHMSVSGAVLNDSHAEIVSRRCLVKFLYSQMDLLTDPAAANQSIFIRNPQSDQYPYKLKSGVHFHLYINTAPCGDARIFSPHENDSGVDKHPNRKARGQLRTKIESGEGTIPVKSSDGIQTWDGVLQGQRLLTMSCSDKIARWNILGVQGALLASLMEPIYLHSIVLGSLLHPEHMYRAVCGRIEKSIQGLPPPYHLNKPRLALVTSAEPRNQAKAPNFGINWTIGDTEIEVVNSLTGKTVNNQISRITKQRFFAKFAHLLRKLPGIQLRSINQDYGETKKSIKDYQTAKRELFDAFRREDLGNWLKKPIEQDEFDLAE